MSYIIIYLVLSQRSSNSDIFVDDQKHEVLKKYLLSKDNKYSYESTRCTRNMIVLTSFLI